jgi:hypothetical protein
MKPESSSLFRFPPPWRKTSSHLHIYTNWNSESLMGSMVRNYSILGVSCALADSDFYMCLYSTTTNPKKIWAIPEPRKRENNTQGATKLIIFPSR